MKKIDRETGKPFTLELTGQLQNDLESHYSRECQHPTTGVRRIAISGGSLQYRTVCLSCGHRIGNAIKKSAAPSSCEPEDVSIREKHDARREAELDEVYQRHIKKQKSTGQGFKARYHSYLESEQWLSRRAKVLQRANNLCEGCRENPATQVHHLHYAHVFDELLYELVALCDDCHNKAHQHIPISIDEHRELVCNDCRWGGWSDSKGSWCEQFDVATGVALSPDGECGPNAERFELLK